MSAENGLLALPAMDSRTVVRSLQESLRELAALVPSPANAARRLTSSLTAWARAAAFGFRFSVPLARLGRVQTPDDAWLLAESLLPITRTLPDPPRSLVGDSDFWLSLDQRMQYAIAWAGALGDRGDEIVPRYDAFELARDERLPPELRRVFLVEELIRPLVILLVLDDMTGGIWLGRVLRKRELIERTVLEGVDLLLAFLSGVGPRTVPEPMFELPPAMDLPAIVARWHQARRAS